MNTQKIVEAAPIVEVVGSRFLRRFNQDSDATTNRDIPWTLRFPRVAKWCEATDGVVADTVASFRAKAVAAFSRSGPREGAEAEAEDEAATLLVPLKPLTWQPAAKKNTADGGSASQWWQAPRRDAAPTSAPAAPAHQWRRYARPRVRRRSAPASQEARGQRSKRSKKRNAAHVQSDQDYLTGESGEHVSKISFEGKGAERGEWSTGRGSAVTGGAV